MASGRTGAIEPGEIQARRFPDGWALRAWEPRARERPNRNAIAFHIAWRIVDFEAICFFGRGDGSDNSRGVVRRAGSKLRTLVLSLSLRGALECRRLPLNLRVLLISEILPPSIVRT
jgi:hypothetical protein